MPFLANNCESLNLISLKGEYIAFILEIEIELNYLEHFLNCPKCLAELIKKVENKEVDGIWGNIFYGEEKNDQVEKSNYMGFPTTEMFVEARIQWRLERLRSLAVDAEMELENLQERIVNQEG
jgi:hypothetical protein